MSASEFDSPPGVTATAWLPPEGWLKTIACRLAVYLPLEGLVAGRRILDVHGISVAHERWRRAGARAVVGAGRPPWELPDASVDGVFLLAGDTTYVDVAVLAEVKRVLSPNGFVVWRLLADATSEQRGPVTALHAAFDTVEVINQVPIAGFTFDREGNSEVVVAEDLFPTSALPSHVLALCVQRHERPWSALESWVVPLANPNLRESAPPPAPDQRAAWEQRLADLTLEREYLREAVMTLQDERDRLQRLATNLRREADRNLARMSDQAAALEVLGLERDQALRHADKTDESQLRQEPVQNQDAQVFDTNNSRSGPA